jgi:chemotaxis protein histidine kinase CheA
MANEVIPEALSRRYVESFASKGEALERALALVAEDETEGLKLLRDLAHKLAGSAGMYGFDDLGHLAREVVHTIDAGIGQTIIGGLTDGLIKRLAGARAALGV